MKRSKNKLLEFIRSFNPEWFKKYLLIPFIMILSISVTCGVIIINYIKFINNYNQKIFLQQQELKLQEEQKDKEDKEKLEKYQQMQIIKEQEDLKKQKETEARRQNIEFQNKVMSKDWPKGTYVYNKETEKYGIVDHCEIPFVITQEGWSFEITEMEDGFKNPNIIQVGWLDWYNWSQKELTKKSKEYQKKLKDIIKNEQAKRQQEARKKFPPNPKYGYCKYKGEYYYVIKWTNGVLTLRHRHEDPRKKNYIQVAYDDSNVLKLEKGEMRKFYISNS